MNDMHQLNDARPHIVIIGGGITGLSAAYYLERAALAAGHPVRCTLVERDERLGGKIRTDWHGEHLVEGGPDSFVTQKPWAADLARDLGLGDTIHAAESARHATYVLQGRRLTPLPDGTLLIIPTRFWPFITSPLISPLGKLRMGLDLITPARRDEGDESLADFIRRRLGSEALDRLAEPLMAGIHSAECERQSLLATFPRFRETEQRHGSLIRGMVAARRAAAARPGPAQSPFTTLRGGLGSLVDALRAKIAATIRTGCSVVAIDRALDAGRHMVRLSDGTRLDADAVIVTTPAYSAADLLAPLSETLAAQLRSIRYVTTATITIGLREEQITRQLDGYGVIIPRSERRRINACTISSRKFAGRAPAGSALVRAFVGGSRTPEALALDDAALIDTAVAELRSILGIVGEPQFARLYRWERGNPQYDVGHLERTAAIERLQPPGIWLAGAAYQGVGIPDCIRQGRAAAEQALQHLCATAAAPALAPAAS
jgi:protoporphyrinogen/coproporphyrinogen III oxidase